MPADLSATKSTTLFTLETLKAWLKTQGVDPSDDRRLVIAADGASAEIENDTGVYFVQRSVTEVFSGDGKCTRILKYAPVASIDSFTIGGVSVDPSTYVLDSDVGIITFTAGGFTCGVQNVSIVYTAGFDVQDGPNLPGDVYRAGLDLANAIYAELTANAIAATTVSLGASTMVIKAAKRPPSVQRVIDSWAASGFRP